MKISFAFLMNNAFNSFHYLVSSVVDGWALSLSLEA